MSVSKNREPLSILPRAVAAFTGGQTKSYFVFYNLGLQARIPVERGTNGRWYFDPNDVPKIAGAVGLSAHEAGHG